MCATKRLGSAVFVQRVRLIVYTVIQSADPNHFRRTAVFLYFMLGQVPYLHARDVMLLRVEGVRGHLYLLVQR